MRLAAFALLLLAPVVAEGQRWRTVEVARQIRDSAEHVVKVRYGAGVLSLTPGDGSLLFDMSMRYDEEHTEAVHLYDAEGRNITLGISGLNVSLGRRGTSRGRAGEMKVALSPAVPMALTVELSAGRGEVELGGMALRSLRLESNAAETKAAFSRRNSERMERIEVDASAGSVRVSGVPNANTPTVRVNGSVAAIVLDFSGRWTESVAVEARMSVGSLTLRVPEHVGVRVEGRRSMSRVSHGGTLESRGRDLVSPNWESASHRLTVFYDATLSSLRVERVR
jgi:hypothetical protein